MCISHVIRIFNLFCSGVGLPACSSPSVSRASEAMAGCYGSLGLVRLHEPTQKLHVMFAHKEHLQLPNAIGRAFIFVCISVLVMLRLRGEVIEQTAQPIQDSGVPGNIGRRAGHPVHQQFQVFNSLILATGDAEAGIVPSNDLLVPKWLYNRHSSPYIHHS